MDSETFLDLIHFLCVQNLAEDKRVTWEGQLTMPPPGEDVAPGSPWSAEAELASFPIDVPRRG